MDIKKFKSVAVAIETYKILKKNTSNKVHKKIDFVRDRFGHDFRYSIDNSKIIHELKWVPNKNLEERITNYIIDYIKNEKEI